MQHSKQAHTPKMAPQDSYLFLNFLEQKDGLADVIVHACNPVLTLERPRQGSREFEANLSYILVSRTNNKVKYSSTSKLSLTYKWFWVCPYISLFLYQSKNNISCFRGYISLEELIRKEGREKKKQCCSSNLKFGHELILVWSLTEFFLVSHSMSIT